MIAACISMMSTVGFLAVALLTDALDSLGLLSGAGLMGMILVINVATPVMALVVAAVYLVGSCPPRALGWWCLAATSSSMAFALIISGALWAAAGFALGAVFFGGREPGSPLLDEPAIASLRSSWNWVRDHREDLPRHWRWRLALGRAPWWFGLLGLAGVITAVAGLAALGSALPGGGGGGAAAVAALPYMIIGFVLGLPLLGAAAFMAALFVAAILLIMATQWFTDGVVLHGRPGTTPSLRARARLLHASTDLTLLACIALPFFTASAEHNLGIAAWLFLPILIAIRILYVSVVAAGSEGTRSALYQTVWLIFRRPLAVARVLVVQLVGALALAIPAIPLFLICALISSPAWLLAALPHGIAFAAGATAEAHMWLLFAESGGFLLLNATLAGRVLAPGLLWHTRHRVCFVQLIMASS